MSDINETIPYYSITDEGTPEHRYVYHNRLDCKYGQRILVENLEFGTDDRHECDECVRLDRDGVLHLLEIIDQERTARWTNLMELLSKHN